MENKGQKEKVVLRPPQNYVSPAPEPPMLLPDSCNTCGHPSYWHSHRGEKCNAAYGDEPGLEGGKRCECPEYV